MVSRKRARPASTKKDGIGDDVNAITEGDTIERKGVTWRRNPTKCVVEMRPPNWKSKLHFGSYDNEDEAMVARDYGAFLRHSAGENGDDAGGFDDHSRLYQFEESCRIFESMDQTRARRNTYEWLLPMYQQRKENCNRGDDGRLPHRKFCEDAREDIEAAIPKFREIYPQSFPTSRPTDQSRKDVPKADPGDGGVHPSPDIRVSRSEPTVPGDSTFWENLLEITTPRMIDENSVPVQFTVGGNGFLLQILLDMNFRLPQERMIQILRTWIDKVKTELDDAVIDKFLGESDRLVAPTSIPPLDDSEPLHDHSETEMEQLRALGI